MAEGHGARNMSARGDPSPKHGGGRSLKTAGIPLIINTPAINANLTPRPGFVGVSEVGEGVGLIQDGGGLVVGAEGLVVDPGLLPTTSGLPPGTTLSLPDNTTDTALSLHGTTITNAEWLKAKFGNLGGVFVIQNGAVSGEGSECLTALDLREVREVGGLTLSNSSQTGLDGLVEVSGASIQQTGSILVTQAPVNPTVTAVRTSDGTAVSLLSASCRLGDNSGKEGEELSEPYRVTLDELDRQHQFKMEMGEEEEEEDSGGSRQEFEDMEFEMVSSDKSNMLMTPQELELMPERGKEFEESVGPKEEPAVLTAESEDVTDLMSDTQVTDQPGSFILASSSGKPVSILNPNLVPASTAANSVLTVLPNVNTTNQVLNQMQLAVPAVDPQVTPGTATTTAAEAGTPGLATISIATDNSSNSTQILINTPQGQQIFQINTADLNQATSTLQPLCLSGGLVGKDDSGKIVHAGTANGITVEDGKIRVRVTNIL